MVGIDILNEKYYGKIDVSISKRNNKRYGCCRQEEPDKRYKAITKRGRKKIIRYERFNRHHIEISKWVLELEDNIIKNTIIQIGSIDHLFRFQRLTNSLTIVS